MHFIMWLYHDYTDLKSQLYKKNPQMGNKIKTWQRPTLPRTRPQYHRREGVLLPCSGWERVSPPCYGRQETTVILR